MRREELIQIRCTSKEKEKIRIEAEKKEMSIPEYIRRKILK